MRILSNFFPDICIFYRPEWKLGQNHKNTDIFRTLVSILMKPHTFIDIFITNHLEQFSDQWSTLWYFPDQNVNSNPSP